MIENQIFKRTIKSLILSLLISTLFSTASAEKDNKSQMKRKPPPEAFSACAELEEDSACSFSTEDGKNIKGSCKEPRRSAESLVCKPNRGHDKRKHQRKRD